MKTAQNRSSQVHNGQQRENMEFLAHSILLASLPNEDLVNAVRRSLLSRPIKRDGHLVYGRGDPDACARFLKWGTEENNAVCFVPRDQSQRLSLQFSQKVNEAIGEVPFFVRQGPMIISSAGNPTTWRRKLAHPSPGAVSIFRDLSSASEGSVTFKLYMTSSQGSSTEGIADADYPYVTRKLKPDEILFVKGLILMDIDVPSGGAFVWQGNSGNSMGLDILSPQAFPFMKI